MHFSSRIPKMSMFTLAISCLTTSNLPWFMDLTFQVPMQYCSIQHWTLFLPPDTSTTRYYFCFGLAFSFLLELFLYCSPVVYQTPPDLESSSFSVTSFYLFILFVKLLRQECWSGFFIIQPFHSPLKWIPFSSGPCFVKLSTMTHPSWVALHGMAYSFTELDNAVIHMISLIIK